MRVEQGRIIETDEVLLEYLRRERGELIKRVWEWAVLAGTAAAIVTIIVTIGLILNALTGSTGL